MSTARRHLLACVSALALIAGCSTAGSSVSPSAAATPSPTESATALVYGSMSCQQTSMDTRTEGGNKIFVEHFRCTYAVNDPRLDGGQYEADFVTTFEADGGPAARFEATVMITTEDGSWTGETRGALVFWKTGGGGPYNYGESTYTGSGAYEGLVYHELAAGGNEGLTVTGAIERAE